MLWGCFAGVGGIMASWGEKWCGYIEATSHDIGQEVKACSQMGLPNGQWPQAFSQSCGKKLLRTSQCIGVAITMPWPQSCKKCMDRTEKSCAGKEAYKPDSVTPALSGGMGQHSPQLIVWTLWKATWNVWPKLNHLKPMLPNTNWVYVNFWPTGNVMKERKA